MAYRLINIQTGAIFTCDDHVWYGILECARLHGWNEKGTTIDFHTEVENAWDERVQYDLNLLNLFRIHMFRLKWNGNYEEKENQVVSDEDASGLFEVLAGNCRFIDFHEFLRYGGFKISGAE